MSFPFSWGLWYFVGFIVFTVFTWKKKLPTLVDFSVSVFWPVTAIVMAASYGLLCVLENLTVELDNDVQQDDRSEV